MRAKIHRWVRLCHADDYVRLGWVPQTTFAGTMHGLYSVHMSWLCETCPPVIPLAERRAQAFFASQAGDIVRRA